MICLDKLNGRLCPTFTPILFAIPLHLDLYARYRLLRPYMVVGMAKLTGSFGFTLRHCLAATMMEIPLSSMPHSNEKSITCSTHMAQFSTWKKTALYLTCLVTALTTLLIILLFLSLFHPEQNEIYASRISRDEDALGLSILYEGDCKETAKIDLWLHLVIKIIGTSILASSNFFMQGLVAPVRAEVDAAHRSGHWLEIGVPSLLNFRFLSRRKIIYWSLFCLSSVPLQLTFNGAVLEARSTNAAMVILGAEELVKGDWYIRDPIYYMSMENYRNSQREP